MSTKLTFSDILVLKKTASSFFMTRLIFHKLILIALIMLLSVNYFLIFSHIRFCVQSIPDEPTDSDESFYQWPLSTLVQ